ncbi:hypothetical protein ACFPK9_06050 [Rubritalea spongiae]|uniref:Secreted protein n=1 Tax=Rubritalea spongiae TaxID=430797 RepID=A0ABW5E476_9BACT
MRALLAKLFCLIAAISLIDGHIIALQTYAWVTMLNDRIPEQGVGEALSTTFDGEHPCEHCLAAEDLQTKSQKEKSKAPDMQLSWIKLISPKAEKITLPPAPPYKLLPHLVETLSPSTDHSTSVPSPPPRA